MMSNVLDEKRRRVLAASIATGYGYGEIQLVSRMGGANRATIAAGIREIRDGSKEELASQQARRQGAGRPRSEVKYPEIEHRIQEIVDESTVEPQKRS